jgi:hypothetical protein
MGLFKKTLLGIPISLLVALLALLLIGGGVFAAFSFLNLQVQMEVREPIVVSYDLGWDSQGFILASGSVPILLDSCTAGDIGTVTLRIQNKSSGLIKVKTGLTGDVSNFEITGLPGETGWDIGANSTATGVVSIKVKNSAPPGSYTFWIPFSRE